MEESEIKRFISQTATRLKAETSLRGANFAKPELWRMAVRISYLVPGFNVTAEDETPPDYWTNKV